MPRYKLTIEYDGTDFCGWQRQNTDPSVQQNVEEAIAAFSGTEEPIFCAGRTDAGVHALGQVVHFDMPHNRSNHSVMQGLNHHLRPLPIAIVAAEQVNDEFHARFSATQRHYVYRLVSRRARLALDEKRIWQIPYDLDVDAMNKAAQLLIGTHDFSSFRDSMCQAKSPVKTLEHLEVKEISGDFGTEICIYVSALSFLHHQVRNITGSLVQVGRSKWNVDDFHAARDACDRTKGGPTAPAHGLYFMQVEY